ncbi:MAG TPA: biopolymer transporter ExbD [Planctomycetota bacterium]|nr:biopolymer transporter ExbD [Planctomycetota bacterium]
MAGGGGGDDEENPVPVNCVALIDIIFCLCIFFMCSFHFKQLEGKIDSWLPKDKGVHGTPVQNVVLEEMRVILHWDEASQSVETKYGSRPISNDQELGDLLSESHAEYVNQGKPDVSIIIDAEPHVPWKSVINVMNICKKRDLEKIEFAAPLPQMGAPSGGTPN